MTPDESLRRLAERQHALVALDQAAQWLNRRQVRRRLAAGAWVLVTPRVMRLNGAPSSPQLRTMAGVLDAGAQTSASYAAAAHLWRLPGPWAGVVELSRERGVSGRHPSLGWLHEPRYLPPHHLTVVRGVPVTTLPRTLFDLAGRLHPARTERLVASVIGKSPRTLRTLHAMLPELAEHGRNGIVVMRDVLERNPIGCVREETALERRVNSILVEAGEEPLIPQVNVGGHEWIGRVDFRDPIVVTVLYEVDSQLYHSSPLDRALDAARDDALRAAGFSRVVRIAEEHVWWEPWRVLDTVRRVRRAAA